MMAIMQDKKRYRVSFDHEEGHEDREIMAVSPEAAVFETGQDWYIDMPVTNLKVTEAAIAPEPA